LVPLPSALPLTELTELRHAADTIPIQRATRTVAEPGLRLGKIGLVSGAALWASALSMASGRTGPAGIEYDHHFMGDSNNSFSVANPVR
jgi:hypothetical protein